MERGAKAVKSLRQRLGSSNLLASLIAWADNALAGSSYADAIKKMSSLIDKKSEEEAQRWRERGQQQYAAKKLLIALDAYNEVFPVKYQNIHNANYGDCI